MSRRPLPEIEESAPLESGVGPTATTATDQSAAAGQQPAAAPPAGQAPAEPGRDLVHAPGPPASPLPPAAGDRPRAEELVTRAQDLEREQINAMTPKVLRLRRRMRQYGLDHDVELRDIVSMALDEWLTRRNY